MDAIVLMSLYIWYFPVSYHMYKHRKKETPHSFNGQQLGNKSCNLVVIYIKFVTRDPRLANIHDELAENMRVSKVALRKE